MRRRKRLDHAEMNIKLAPCGQPVELKRGAIIAR
jgi:hypothetical protein